VVSFFVGRLPEAVGDDLDRAIPAIIIADGVVRKRSSFSTAEV
jgi:hypothetical protein